jgi:5'(3')-deoxyribonucleotidase
MRFSEIVQNNKPEVYLDMDGVLADFVYGYNKVAGTDIKSQWDLPKAKQDPVFAKIAGTDFFQTLPKFPSADKLVDLVIQKFGHYNICSSPLRNDYENSEKHKTIWLQKHLNPQPKNIIITPRKEKYAVQADGTPNILIDDKAENIQRWQAQGGIGILYNAAVDSLDNVAQVLNSDLSEHIVKVKGGYRLVSKKSGRNLGTYPTKAGAKKRERQVQYFKHKGMAESLDEAVGDNYLYHATMPAGLMRILKDGKMKASWRPQAATTAKTKYPTVSTTRSKQYAESDEFVNFLNLTKEGNAAIMVFDRNALANHYKMFSTSQGTQNVGDEYEEVIVVPKGALPIKGILKGFYFNPKRAAEIQEYKDIPWFQELLKSPYYLGPKQGVAEGEHES